MRTFPFGRNGLAEDPVLRELRETEPVCKVRLATGGEAWLITRYDDVRMVESDPRFSRVAATRPGTPTVWPDFRLPQSILSLDPPHHDVVRRLLASAFTQRRVERLRPRVERIADDLLDAMEERGAPADLFDAFAHPLPVVVIGEVLGMPPTDHALFRGWLDVMLDPSSAPDVVGNAFGGMHAYLVALIEDKRANPGDDVLTAVVQASEDGTRLSAEELLHNTQGLIFAGQDTTANMLANSVITLLRHPDQLASLRANPDLVPRAVEELLRYVPTLIASPTRVSTVDVEVGGTVIPAGDAVLTIESSANRDEAAFDEPERFDITRTGQPGHLGFGHGPHFCLGASLARLELTIAITALVARFPNLRLAVPESDLEWLPNRIVYTTRKLPVSW